MFTLLIARWIQFFSISCLFIAITVLVVVSVAGDPIITMIANATQCPTPISITINPSGTYIYVACLGDDITSNGTILQINPTTDVISPLIPESSTSLCVSPSFITVDTYTIQSYDRVYITCSVTESIIMIDPQSNIITTMMNSTDRCINPISIYIDSSLKLITCQLGGGVVQMNNDLISLLASSQCPQPQHIVKQQVYPGDDHTKKQLYIACGGNPGARGGGIISLTPYGILGDWSYRILLTQPTCAIPKRMYAAMPHKDGISGTLYVACSTSMWSPGSILAITDIEASTPTVSVIANVTSCPNPIAITAYPHTATSIYAACSDRVIRIRNGIITTLTTPEQCPHPTDVMVMNKYLVVIACGGGGVITIQDDPPAY